MKILYEDNHLLVVEKPANLPVQADASGDADLLTLLKAYIKEKYNKPGEVYLGLVHRLDRPVGGVMVFARTSKAAARLSAQFKGRGAQKKYVALLCGDAPGGELRDALLRLPDGTTNVAPGDPEAKPAALLYRRAGKANGLTLADVRLLSGRHHQIRVQFASRSLPVWGDQRYNPAAKPGQQIALFAYSLTVEHPTLRQPMTFTALPEGGAWEPFQTELLALEAGVRLAYCDARLLAVDKDAGVEVTAEEAAPAAAAETAAGPAVESPEPAQGGGLAPAKTLEERLSAVFGKVYPLHRLDVNTTGLVLFARDAEAAQLLREAIRVRDVHKTYECLVKGAPPKAGDTLRAWCLKDEKRARVTVYDREVPGAKEMLTGYRLLGREGECSRLEIDLITGRTHQIRAHLAYAGCPILGDDKYGDRDFNRAQHCRLPRLCAVRLRFALPADSPLAYLNAVELCVPPTF